MSSQDPLPQSGKPKSGWEPIAHCASLKSQILDVPPSTPDVGPGFFLFTTSDSMLHLLFHQEKKKKKKEKKVHRFGLIKPSRPPPRPLPQLPGLFGSDAVTNRPGPSVLFADSVANPLLSSYPRLPLYAKTENRTNKKVRIPKPFEAGSVATLPLPQV